MNLINFIVFSLINATPAAVIDGTAIRPAGRCVQLASLIVKSSMMPDPWRGRVLQYPVPTNPAGDRDDTRLLLGGVYPADRFIWNESESVLPIFNWDDPGHVDNPHFMIRSGPDVLIAGQHIPGLITRDRGTKVIVLLTQTAKKPGSKQVTYQLTFLKKNESFITDDLLGQPKAAAILSNGNVVVVVQGENRALLQMFAVDGTLLKTFPYIPGGTVDLKKNWDWQDYLLPTPDGQLVSVIERGYFKTSDDNVIEVLLHDFNRSRIISVGTINNPQAKRLMVVGQPEISEDGSKVKIYYKTYDPNQAPVYSKTFALR